MGQDWRPNRALSNPLIHRVLNLTESRILLSTSKAEREKWVIAGIYFCFYYVLSLRSPEGLMVDLPGLIEFSEKRVDCVVIPLLGQVKGENHTRYHLRHCVNRAKSGIQVRAWVKRLRALHSHNRCTSGPAFINSVTGLHSSTSEMNDLSQELLAEIFEEDRELFGIDIRSAADLSDKYNVFRSFRRGSESRAVSENVSEPDRYVVNRWRKLGVVR